MTHPAPDPAEPLDPSAPFDPADPEDDDGVEVIDLAAREFDVLVAGDLNPDILVLDPDPTPVFGQVEKLVAGIRMTIGGSSAIMACGAARLGLRTAFCGVIGEDEFGASMLASMAEHGVDVRACKVDPHVPTGATVILSTGDDRAILTATGTIDRLQVDDIPLGLLATSRHLHVGSTALQPGLRAGLPDLFALARALGVTTSFDANWDPDERWEGTAALLAVADICFPNLAEARRWSGEHDPERAARALAAGVAGPRDPEAGPLTVVVKLGARGAIAARGDLVVHAPSPKVHVVDATGAGDSFAAGFVAAHVSGWPLEEALRLATSCGAASVRAAGGVDGQITLEEAETLLRTLA
ncbi:MAG: sugar kinase [Chloroflexota bacterium]